MRKNNMRISLGCGRTIKEGVEGLDIESFGWNKVWDATKDAIPYADDSVDYIEMYNFLEHIERKYWLALFNECHRVLRRDGILEIKAPDAAADINLALQDPTHVSLVVKGTLTNYLTGARPRNADYGFKQWIVIWCGQQSDEPRVIHALLTPKKPILEKGK